MWAPPVCLLVVCLCVCLCVCVFCFRQAHARPSTSSRSACRSAVGLGWGGRAHGRGGVLEGTLERVHLQRKITLEGLGVPLASARPRGGWKRANPPKSLFRTLTRTPARPLAPSLRPPNLAQGAGLPAPPGQAGAASRQGTAPTFPRLAWLVSPPPVATTAPSGGGR